MPNEAAMEPSDEEKLVDQILVLHAELTKQLGIRFKAQVTIQNIKYVRQTVWQGPTEKENASSPILYSQEDRLFLR